MKLQTNIQLQAQTPAIGYDSKILLVGSCFSEHIGAQFQYYKFQSLQNPFGILFHPFAIERFIKNAVEKKKYVATQLTTHQERWHSFDAHSSLSSSQKETTLHNLNSALAETRQFLKTASHVLITLGTSWVYQHIPTQEFVANCHKVPQKYFQKKLISASEIERSLQQIITDIQKLNPSVQCIFTISPVRHLKDGFVENQQSKANLVVALQQLMSQNAKKYAYFPSYEIMLDELRDYRFYTEDMLHPNRIAVQYIWEKFAEVWLDSSTGAIMKTIAGIQKSLQHKAFNPESEEHRHFREQLQQKIKKVSEEIPHISFSF